ncbi:MAG TPA: ribosome biogenesis GTP-binding protein YsxC [Deltaproteobacteria bacterium]|nr:ribosome biogenesis GTP-binding protein YsxC [Deltaproteobacteria bacterium]
MTKKKLVAARLICTSYLPEQVPPMRGPTAIFLGRSNAGKSSLLNALLNKKLAHVSKAPGKTRSVNFFRWGSRLNCVDVPGYGFAGRGKAEKSGWKELMETFFEKLPEHAMAYLLLDAKRLPEAEEILLIEALAERSIPVELLLTKVDRLDQSGRERCRREMSRLFGGVEITEKDASRFTFHASHLTWRFVSAKTGEGIAALRRALLDYAKAFQV